jgi:hypothetical protein
MIEFTQLAACGPDVCYLPPGQILWVSKKYLTINSD